MNEGRIGLLLIAIAMIAAGGLGAYYVLTNLGDDSLDIDAVDRPADQRLLFIGNSYTHYNDLDEMVATMLQQSVPEWNDVLTGREAPGGQRFVNHLAVVEDSAANPPLRQALVTGSDTLRAWDAVVLQEQSQIIGFALQDNDTTESFASAARLHNDYIRPTGATTLLFMTWGRRDGDDLNPGIYPNFLAMQQRLSDNTDLLAERLRAQGGDAYVLPVGLAFFTVYRDTEANGQTPTASGTRFHALYDGDGSHPSLAGSYLAAATIAVAYSGRPVVDIGYVPNGLNADEARYYREVADRVVLGGEFPGRRYPWNS